MLLEDDVEEKTKKQRDTQQKIGADRERIIRLDVDGEKVEEQRLSLSLL